MNSLASREALKDAISSGKFVDTKIVLFSRRDNAGRIYKPKSLYANSHVLRTVPYFENRESLLRFSTAHRIILLLVLFGPFAEAKSRDFSEVDGDEFAEDYGYSSDSDLEEDQDSETPGSVGGQSTTSPPQQEVPDGHYEEDTQTGKVIKVQDIAFIT